MLRENSRRANVQIIFSFGKGKTWTEPRSLPNELNSDSHVLRYAPDADNTFVVTTYGHRDKGKQPYILSVRFTLKELDKKLKEIK
ncbi:MAG: sialidase family protein [Bacteroidales bacterium]